VKTGGGAEQEQLEQTNIALVCYFFGYGYDACTLLDSQRKMLSGN
jgi:hypothetical protein